MGLIDIFKVNSIKEQLEECKQQLITLEVQNKKLNALLTPEMRNLQQLNSKIDTANKELIELQRKIDMRASSIKDLDKLIAEKQSQVVIQNELIELETFALYTPRYEFANSQEYREKLKQIRDKQKAMIKSGNAVSWNSSWTVNGSRTQGTKLAKDMATLCLRSFNNECDVAVNSVKFNNYDRCEQRIKKSSTAVEKLGKSMNISINKIYTQLKLEELQLALEYQIKKQEEKEALKELRAQQREEARVAKELEEARKAAEKEQKHYEKAYSDILSQLKNCNEYDKELLIAKKVEIELRLEQIRENIKNIDYREANQRAGYVYVISNIGAFGENVFKIGMTRRLKPQERVDELGDASVPFNFDVHAMIFSDDAPKLEAALHNAFEDRKINLINTRREFFNVSLEEIKKIVKENHDKTVEFIDVAEAAQYRESLKLKELKQ